MFWSGGDQCYPLFMQVTLKDTVRFFKIRQNVLWFRFVYIFKFIKVVYLSHRISNEIKSTIIFGT